MNPLDMAPDILIPPGVRATIVAVLAAGLMVLGGWAGWEIQGWRKGSEIAELQRAHADAMAAISAKAVEASERARATEDYWQKAISVSDQQHADKVAHDETEIRNLRTAVDAGAVQLRIAAHCPASGGELPGATASARVDDGPGVELDATARQDYYDLRAAIAHDQEIIRGLQDYAKAISGTMAAPPSENPTRE